MHPDRETIEIDLHQRLLRDPTLNSRAAVAVALQAFESAASGQAEPASNATIRIYRVNRIADQLADVLDNPQSMSPLELLRAVHGALATQYPSYHGSLLDDRAMDIAGALRQRNTDAASGGRRLSPSYRRHVIVELAARASAAQLIPWEALPPATDRLWFDGMALHGALGKRVADLALTLAAEHLAQATADAHAANRTLPANPLAFSASHIEAMLRTRQHNLRESARFPFGMPQQSIDTIVMRLAPIHNVTIAAGDDFSTVMGNFNRLCKAWSESPKYHLSPPLAAALHLARTSGLVILRSGPVPPQHVEWVRTHYATMRALQKDPAPAAALAQWEQAQGQTIWQALPRLAVAPDDPSMPELGRRIFQVYLKRMHTIETIVADTPAEVEDNLIKYFQERLQAYVPLPRFSEDRALLNMWKSQYHVSEEWLNTTRTFPCLTTGEFLTGLRQTDCKGPALEELRVRENAIGGYQNMVVGRYKFNAVEEREKVRPFYLQQLGKNPVLRARAKEMLRMTGQSLTASGTASMTKQLAERTADAKIANYLDFFLKIIQSLTTSSWPLHIGEILSRGDPKEILSLLPFIVPSYEIEEGIRHGDNSRALRGTFQFGMDALMAWIGGKIDARLALPSELPAV